MSTTSQTILIKESDLFYRFYQSYGKCLELKHVKYFPLLFRQVIGDQLYYGFSPSIPSSTASSTSFSFQVGSLPVTVLRDRLETVVKLASLQDSKDSFMINLRSVLDLYNCYFGENFNKSRRHLKESHYMEDTVLHLNLLKLNPCIVHAVDKKGVSFFRYHLDALTEEQERSFEEEKRLFEEDSRKKPEENMKKRSLENEENEGISFASWVALKRKKKSEKEEDQVNKREEQIVDTSSKSSSGVSSSRTVRASPVHEAVPFSASPSLVSPSFTSSSSSSSFSSSLPTSSSSSMSPVVVDSLLKKRLLDVVEASGTNGILLNDLPFKYYVMFNESIDRTVIPQLMEQLHSEVKEEGQLLITYVQTTEFKPKYYISSLSQLGSIGGSSSLLSLISRFSSSPIVNEERLNPLLSQLLQIIEASGTNGIFLDDIPFKYFTMFNKSLNEVLLTAVGRSTPSVLSELLSLLPFRVSTQSIQTVELKPRYYLSYASRTTSSNEHHQPLYPPLKQPQQSPLLITNETSANSGAVDFPLNVDASTFSSSSNANISVALTTVPSSSASIPSTGVSSSLYPKSVSERILQILQEESKEDKGLPEQSIATLYSIKHGEQLSKEQIQQGLLDLLSTATISLTRRSDYQNHIFYFPTVTTVKQEERSQLIPQQSSEQSLEQSPEQLSPELPVSSLVPLDASNQPATTIVNKGSKVSKASEENIILKNRVIQVIQYFNEKSGNSGIYKLAISSRYKEMFNEEMPFPKKVKYSHFLFSLPDVIRGYSMVSGKEVQKYYYKTLPKDVSLVSSAVKSKANDVSPSASSTSVSSAAVDEIAASSSSFGDSSLPVLSSFVSNPLTRLSSPSSSLPSSPSSSASMAPITEKEMRNKPKDNEMKSRVAAVIQRFNESSGNSGISKSAIAYRYRRMFKEEMVLSKGIHFPDFLLSLPDVILGYSIVNGNEVQKYYYKTLPKDGSVALSPLSPLSVRVSASSSSISSSQVLPELSPSATASRNKASSSLSSVSSAAAAPVAAVASAVKKLSKADEIKNRVKEVVQSFNEKSGNSGIFELDIPYYYEQMFREKLILPKKFLKLSDMLIALPDIVKDCRLINGQEIQKYYYKTFPSELFKPVVSSPSPVASFSISSSSSSSPSSSSSSKTLQLPDTVNDTSASSPLDSASEIVVSSTLPAEVNCSISSGSSSLVNPLPSTLPSDALSDLPSAVSPPLISTTSSSSLSSLPPVSLEEMKNRIKQVIEVLSTKHQVQAISSQRIAKQYTSSYQRDLLKDLSSFNQPSVSLFSVVCSLEADGVKLLRYEGDEESFHCYYQSFPNQRHIKESLRNIFLSSVAEGNNRVQQEGITENKLFQKYYKNNKKLLLFPIHLSFYEFLQELFPSSSSPSPSSQQIIRKEEEKDLKNVKYILQENDKKTQKEVEVTEPPSGASSSEAVNASSELERLKHRVKEIIVTKCGSYYRQEGIKINKINHVYRDSYKRFLYHDLYQATYDKDKSIEENMKALNLEDLLSSISELQLVKTYSEEEKTTITRIFHQRFPKQGEEKRQITKASENVVNSNDRTETDVKDKSVKTDEEKLIKQEDAAEISIATSNEGYSDNEIKKFYGESLVSTPLDQLLKKAKKQKEVVSKEKEEKELVSVSSEILEENQGIEKSSTTIREQPVMESELHLETLIDNTDNKDSISNASFTVEVSSPHTSNENVSFEVSVSDSTSLDATDHVEPLLSPLSSNSSSTSSSSSISSSSSVTTLPSMLIPDVSLEEMKIRLKEVIQQLTENEENPITGVRFLEINKKYEELFSRSLLFELQSHSVKLPQLLKTIPNVVMNNDFSFSYEKSSNERKQEVPVAVMEEIKMENEQASKSSLTSHST
jgi:hypothetical protein